MLALRRLTRQHEPTAYIKMLQRAHEFTATIVGDDIDEKKEHLKRCNAFKEHDIAKLKIGNYSVPKVAIKCKALKTLFPFLIEVSITDLRVANIFA
jgi:hypothetical protein